MFLGCLRTPGAFGLYASHGRGDFGLALYDNVRGRWLP
jgi:hypothetical protein